MLHHDFPTPFVWTEQFVYMHAVEKMVMVETTVVGLRNLICPVFIIKSMAFGIWHSTAWKNSEVWRSYNDSCSYGSLNLGLTTTLITSTAKWETPFSTSRRRFTYGMWPTHLGPQQMTRAKLESLSFPGILEYEHVLPSVNTWRTPMFSRMPVLLWDSTRIKTCS